MLTSMLCTLNELIISILYCLAFTLQVRRAIKEGLIDMKIKKKTYENKKKTYENKRVFVIIHCKPNQLAICSTVLLFF